MPGITLLFTEDSNTSNIILFREETKFKNYSAKVLLKKDNFLLTVNKYKEYPFIFKKYKDIFYFLEGKIYNRNEPEIEKFLYQIYCDFIENKNYEERIKNFILTTDGEFLAGIFEKNNSLIFNDFLGRLPFYLFKDKNKFILSRDIWIIRKFINVPEIDINSLIEYLLFMYPLGEKTLLKNVSRLLPATCIEFKRNTLKIKKLFEWNFEEKENIDFKSGVQNLYSSFLNALENRVQTFKDYKIVLSFSGGFDSRAVFMGLKKINTEFHPVTFIDPDKKHQEDFIISKEINKIAETETKFFEIKEFNLKSMTELIKIKQGLNYAEMGFIMDFSEMLKKELGNNIFYITGDGGDKLLPYLLPSKKLKSIDDLFQFIITKNKIFEPFEIERITGTNFNKVKEKIKEKISEYPENNLNYRYIHFLIYERCFKWLFEGEDRNRYFFWSGTPFYSIEFFKTAVKLKDNYKKYYRLYREFFKLLDGEIAGIRRAGFDYGIFDRKIIIREYLKYFVLKFPFILNFLETKHRRKSFYSPTQNLYNKFTEIFEENDIVKEIFNKKALEEMKENLNREKFFTLLTLFLYFDYLQW